MPVPLRRFYAQKLVDAKENEAKQIEEIRNKSQAKSFEKLVDAKENEAKQIEEIRNKSQAKSFGPNQ